MKQNRPINQSIKILAGGEGSEAGPADKFRAECLVILEDLEDPSFSHGLARYWKLGDLNRLIREEIVRVYREVDHDVP